MTEEFVTNVINKLNVALKRSFSDIENIQVEKDETRCILSFNISDDIANFSWEAKNDASFIMIRCHAHPLGLSDDEKTELGSEIAEKIGNNVNCYVDGDELEIHEFCQVNEDNENAERELFNKTMSFVKAVDSMKNRLKGVLGNSTDIQDEFSEGSDFVTDDPYGFDDIDIIDDIFNPVDNTSGSEVQNIATEEDTQTDASTEPFADNNMNNTKINDDNEKTYSNSNVASDITPEQNEAEESFTEGHETENMPQSDLFSEIESFEKDVEETMQRPENLDDVKVESDDIQDILELSQDDVDLQDVNRVEFVKQQFENAFDNANLSIQDAYNNVKDIVDEASKLSAEFVVKNSEVTARESVINKAKEDMEAERASFQSEKDSIEAAKKQLKEDTDKVVKESEAYIKLSNDNERKESVIISLKQRLNDEKKKVEDINKQLESILNDGSSGSVGQNYIVSLRQTNTYLQETIDKQKKQLQQSVDLINSLKDQKVVQPQTIIKEVPVQNNDELVKKENEWLEKEKEWNDKEASYQKQLNDALNKANAPVQDVPSDDELNELRSKISEYEEIEADLRNNLDNETAQNQKLNDQISSLNDELNSIQEKLDEAEKKLEESGLTDNFSAATSRAIEYANNEGIFMSPIAGESTAMINGTFEDCDVNYDIENKMLYITKPVKKIKQADAKLEELNNIDIKLAFYITEDAKRINCKAACFNLADMPSIIKNVVSELDVIK